MKQPQRDDLTDIQNASPETLQAYYDQWASAYDADLAEMGYTAPQTAAAMLADQALSADAPIADIGCGTGLTGQALNASGFTVLTGLDISQMSLDLAHRKGCYRALHQCDINEPLPLPDNAFAAAQCVGTLTYVRNNEALMRELCRIVQLGGLILFTQRQDMYTAEFSAVLQGLSDAGLWTQVHSSEPQPYLPNYEAFENAADKDIYYVVYRTTS